jgi:hypothetical protein
MANPLAIYLHDHLAGARFAIGVLQDLGAQELNQDVKQCAMKLLPAVEADSSTLEEFAKKIGEGTSVIKDAGAWLAQKAGRLKLSLNEPFGMFEAIEMLSLGVLGKLALWTALESLRKAGHAFEALDLDRLIARAQDQHQLLEKLRLKLAVETLH